MATPAPPSSPHKSLWNKVKDFFHTAGVDVSDVFVAIFGKAQATAFANSAKQLLETDLGQIARDAVKAAMSAASGAEAHQQAFSQIVKEAAALGKSASTSLINMLIELAYQDVQGVFGA